MTKYDAIAILIIVCIAIMLIALSLFLTKTIVEADIPVWLKWFLLR